MILYDMTLDMSKAVQNTFGVPILPQEITQSSGLIVNDNNIILGVMTHARLCFSCRHAMGMNDLRRKGIVLYYIP
jgi:hypothetical protein